MDLAQSKVTFAGILRIGDDARCTTLIDVVRTQGNQECELVAADERVVEAEFLISGEK